MSFLMLLARLINAARIKVLVILVLLPMLSMAQQGKTTATTAKSAGDKKKTSIDFEDELIEGELKKPELFYLLQKKQFNFKRLIKLRENFLPEMRRTAEDIQRSGSGN